MRVRFPYLPPFFMTVECLKCSKLFTPDPCEVRRGRGKFCSRNCCASFLNGLRGQPKVVVSCAVCGRNFEIRESRFKASKSGLFFCSMEHKSQAQRIGGIKEIQPAHYGKTAMDYRTIAFRVYPHHCSRCGYDRIKDVLEVHHKDFDHSNHNPENLEILCPTCHNEEHYYRRMV